MSVIATELERLSIAAAVSAAIGFVRAATMKCVRLIGTAVDVIAEARMQKAALEAELYLNRYRHTSKNDDDLPVVH
jgi:hypothetical protein